MPFIKLGDISVDVIQKEIKNIHLSVYPPNGRVKIAAPLRMDLDTIRVYAISKLGWIKKQQHKIQGQEREAPREYITRESHYFFGKRYLLKLVIKNATPTVTLKHNTIELTVRPGSDVLTKQRVLERWYREKLKAFAEELIAKWEKEMDVDVEDLGIKKMKTKWGTCNINAKRIWLNLELAKKPSKCVEYIVVHEMVHLLERKHNDKFMGYMNKYLPEWRELKSELNRLPVSHVDWSY